MLWTSLIRTSLNPNTLSSQCCFLWCALLWCTCRLAEASSPSITPTRMRYILTRNGAICGSQVLPILGVMDREVSAPHLARLSTQVTVPMWRWEYQAACLFRSLQCSQPSIQTKRLTSVSIYVSVLVCELTQNPHQVYLFWLMKAPSN